MNIDPNKNGNLVGGTVLEYESTMPTKFMIGTEFGQIYRYVCVIMCHNPNNTYSTRNENKFV